MKEVAITSMRRANMRRTNKEFGTDRWLWLRLTATRVLGFSALGFSAMLVGFAILLMAEVASAQDTAHETFGFAEEASRALFAAVQSNDEQAIKRILGDPPPPPPPPPPP